MVACCFEEHMRHYFDATGGNKLTIFRPYRVKTYLHIRRIKGLREMKAMTLFFSDQMSRDLQPGLSSCNRVGGAVHRMTSNACVSIAIEEG